MSKRKQKEERKEVEVVFRTKKYLIRPQTLELCLGYMDDLDDTYNAYVVVGPNGRFSFNQYKFVQGYNKKDKRCMTIIDQMD